MRRRSEIVTSSLWRARHSPSLSATSSVGSFGVRLHAWILGWGWRHCSVSLKFFRFDCALTVCWLCVDCVFARSEVRPCVVCGCVDWWRWLSVFWGDPVRFEGVLTDDSVCTFWGDPVRFEGVLTDDGVCTFWGDLYGLKVCWLMNVCVRSGVTCTVWRCVDWWRCLYVLGWPCTVWRCVDWLRCVYVLRWPCTVWRCVDWWRCVYVLRWPCAVWRCVDWWRCLYVLRWPCTVWMGWLMTAVVCFLRSPYTVDIT